ncbi:hypothetical protein NQT62_06675 [Limnobacter humi]|uniref:ABC transporter permease n=1 Tax=Limnobacter humi TaxID=1778671 RepID=A0ABT1WF66_9BURK|nr:hypothetical protein [Limnobacter humi]MCQ8896120.1 hypothetical protein [Limnobacter humi]
MSVKRFVGFWFVWVLACAWVIEPTLINPLFSVQEPSIALAWNSVNSDLGHAGFLTESLHPVESMDYFRTICMLYLGLPLMAYLATQWKAL